MFSRDLTWSTCLKRTLIIPTMSRKTMGTSVKECLLGTQPGLQCELNFTLFNYAKRSTFVVMKKLSFLGRLEKQITF